MQLQEAMLNSPAGDKASQRFRCSQAQGITLIELLLVLALISLMIGITFPSVTAMQDALRTRAAMRQLTAFLQQATSVASRDQKAVELTVWPKEGKLQWRVIPAGRQELTQLPDHIQMVDVEPRGIGMPAEKPRTYVIYPGAPYPAVAFVLENERRQRFRVRLDPLTGVPASEQLGQVQ